MPQRAGDQRGDQDPAAVPASGPCGISPRATRPPPVTPITSAPSDWRKARSLFYPNFGDYTDNAVSVTGIAPYVGNTLYIAWADGRSGVAQPYVARLPAR
jgi:hypothetical protein